MTTIDPNGKLRGIKDKVTFTEKQLSPNVLVATVMPLYRRAFLKGVWQEDLSVETVIKRLEENFSGNFKGKFIFGVDEKCLAASWYQYVDIDWIRSKKGDLLANLAEIYIKEHAITKIIWHAETMVDPELIKQGLATLIRSEINTEIWNETLEERSPIFACTRMRNDNDGIIKINTRIGYKRTGITMPCTLKPETNHEYWFKIYK